MARGGARKGAGRRAGGKNKTTQKREEALAKAQQKAELILNEPFDGNAHDLLVLVYKNQELPLEVRIDCAKAAIAFERPRLAATALVSRGEMEAEELKNQPRKPAGDRLKAMASAPLKVIEGSLANKEKENV